MTSSRAVLIGLVASIVLSPAVGHAAPIVVELFTSQSCSSCPPADALLAELARQPGVLALDFHVDYWNGLGWHDPFSQHGFTLRQQAYADTLADHEVYTPELVVGGARGVVGSDRDAVQQALAAASTTAKVSMTLRQEGGGLSVDAGSGEGRATLWLVGYDSHHSTRIGGGENGGRTLMEANVVRSMTQVANWSGAPFRRHLAVPDGETAAVLLQAEDGMIIGAATLPALHE